MEPLTLVLFILGLVLLVAGAEGLVRGASRIAATLGISPLVIGLTVVAFGTSAPELAVSTSSALGGNADVAIGNVVGSNIFNILAVLGISALVSGGEVGVADGALRIDFPVMIAVAVICLPSFLTGRLIARWEGIAFMALYVVYVVYLYLSATGSAGVVDGAEVALGLSFVSMAVLFAVLAGRQARRERPAN